MKDYKMSIFPSCFSQKKAITPNENLRTKLAKHKLHSLALSAVLRNKTGEKFEKMLATGNKNLFLGTTLPKDILGEMTQQAQESEVFGDIKKEGYFAQQKGWILCQLIKEILNDDIPEDKKQDYDNDKLAYNIDKYVLKSSLSDSEIIKKIKDEHKHDYTSEDITYTSPRQSTALKITHKLSIDEEFAKSFCKEILKPITKERKQEIKKLDPTSPHPELDLYLSDKNLYVTIKEGISNVLENQSNALEYDYIPTADSDTLHRFLKEISVLEHLKTLTIHHQVNLTALNQISHIKQLKELVLDNTKIPTTIGALKHLHTLHIKNTHIENLPEEIFTLEHLKTFNLKAKAITQLPDNIGNLKQLETFKINCDVLEALPETLYNLEFLKTLEISSNVIVNLSEKINNLKKLETLKLKCNRMKELPKEIGDLKHLKTLCINSVQKLPNTIDNALSLTEINIELPNTIDNAPSLTEIDINSENLRELPDTIGNCTSLTEININSENFQGLPDNIRYLKQLQILDIHYSKEITSLPNTIHECASLTKINITHTSLQELPENIGDLTSLTDINLVYNENLTRLPDSISKLTNLRNLSLAGTAIEYDTLPEALRNNPDIYIDIAPENQNIRGAQSVHAQPIEDRTKDIILFLEKKYPMILSKPSNEQSLSKTEKSARKELQNKTIKSMKETLLKELEKYKNMPDFIPADDAIEKKSDPEDTSKIRYFYQTNDSQKNILVKVIVQKNDKDITYLQPTKKWKILAALRECDVMLSQKLVNTTYKPKEIFTLVMQFLKDMVTKDELEEGDMINNVIDTLYDNRRTYNSAPIDNEAPLDDQQKRDLVSCIPGCVNRIAFMAGLHIDIKPALPSPEDYNNKYMFIMKKTLKDIFHNPDALPHQDVTQDEWKKIKDDVHKEEAITPELWNIIGNDIREKLHHEYEYCGLNKENDLDLWKPQEESYQYFNIVDIIETKGKKPIHEQTFVPNIPSEQGSSSSHS